MNLCEDFRRLIEIMERLRSPDGCPWDREQTNQSIKPYLIEETYEVVDAIDENDPEKLKEELGDLLFQIIFHAQIAKEKGEFDIHDVIEVISKKMISRHPHVFGDKDFKTSEEVLRQWDERKKEEGKQRESILDGIPSHLPALMRAHGIQLRVSKIGFDWKELRDVLRKLDEELMEFRLAIQKNDKSEIEDELGDIFFVLVNISRFVDINPEEALRKTISKFISRFRYIEKRVLKEGRDLKEMTLEEMDNLWEEAKTREK